MYEKNEPPVSPIIGRLDAEKMISYTLVKRANKMRRPRSFWLMFDNTSKRFNSIGSLRGNASGNRQSESRHWEERRQGFKMIT